MEENRFEKQVQAKMEELRLVPSDTVWANVDKEINKKKRRSLPLFWFFLLAVLMLSVPGYFLVRENGRPKEAILDKPKETKPQDYSKNPLKIIGKAESELGKTNNAPENILAIKGNKALKPIVKEKTEGIKAASESMSWSASTRKPRTQSLSRHAPPGLYKKPDATALSINNYDKASGLKENKTDPNNSLSQPENTDRESGSKTEVLQARTNPPAPPKEDKTGLLADNPLSKKDSQPLIKSGGPKKPRKNGAALEIGFGINSGLSMIDQSPFRAAYVNQIGYYTILGANPGTNDTPSRIYTDFSFGVSFFVKKKISKRLSFTAGIGYHYYSTKIYTGKAVDSLVWVYTARTVTSNPANGLLPGLNPNQSYYLRVSTYYPNINTSRYINQYHFLTLPLAVNFQLNRGRTLPLIWEAGLSLAYLINSNALHFDPHADVYYQDNKLFNRLDLQGTTAILASFHLSKNELKIGPQLEYGLTGVLNKTASNSEHLLSGGIKAIFIPHKK